MGRGLNPHVGRKRPPPEGAYQLNGSYQLNGRKYMSSGNSGRSPSSLIRLFAFATLLISTKVV